MEETIILPDALPTMKTCSKCKVEKSATSENFGNDKRNKDNFQGKCRACENKRRRVDAKLDVVGRQHFQRRHGLT